MANLPSLLLLVALLAAASANAQSASGTTSGSTTTTGGSTTGGSTPGGSTAGGVDMTVALGGNPKADPAVVKECTTKMDSLTKCLENADFDAAKTSQADATKQFQNGPCSDSCTTLSKWASAADNLAKCSDALGLAALAMPLAPMALGQACLTKDSKFCYIEYKYSLQAKGVSVEDFNNDPTKLPKDQACTPCMKAMTQYDLDIAKSFNGTMASSSSSSTTDGKTSSSSANLPDTAAIDRINKYCGWDSSSSSSGSAPSGTSSTSTTTGGSGAIAVDVKGAGVYVAMLGAAVAVLGM
ncbi:hypothetical protein AMAG_17010 [Allomyces macrogynus ATCC 38327]|uniref:Uncharacterized protein n=1 Tax=Allomyces macrogynus (strain ATCC 38327) TaxID=578462 RepID=A0A0L0TCJ6_ALLM3|nr:hypothetical protein AMAG_17010 [Allomyces macrogynus ATCC 38327]|eukprot:KNE72568.1 hypothetical protein AMAG_17010 [Allomyces macrogynus ATCC 38327]